MIPAEAVEAANKAAKESFGGKPPRGTRTAIRTVLEAAAPYIIAGHFREMNLKAITNEIENPPNFSKVTP